MIAFIVGAFVGVCAGTIFGIWNCKRNFEIPKGVSTAYEYRKYLNKEVAENA